MQRVLDIEIFKSHLQKIFLTVFLLRLYALDNFWVISPVGVLLISANYAAKNRRAQRWNRLQSRFQYSQNRRAYGIARQCDFFPYSVLICAKSRLRGFRSRAIHAARAVSAISALQAVARNPRSPNVSARSAQPVRKISRSAHFAQYFLSGSAHGEGGNAPQSIKNLFEEQPARGRRLKIIAPFFRCENLFDVGF